MRRAAPLAVLLALAACDHAAAPAAPDNAAAIAAAERKAVADTDAALAEARSAGAAGTKGNDDRLAR